MTKKDYIMIARVIKYNTYGNKLITSNLLNDLSIEFKKDNNRFDRDRFVKACNN